MVAENGTGHDFDFDLITIGAGSGGTRASRISSQQYGARVACVELPFAFVATDSEGGAGGTYVPACCFTLHLGSTRVGGRQALQKQA